jgi:hypothetical protein
MGQSMIKTNNQTPGARWGSGRGEQMNEISVESAGELIAKRDVGSN